MRCPVKNDSWKRLVKYVKDETTAYRVFRAHGEKVPSVPTITELKSKLKFRSKVFSGMDKASLNIRVSQYNKKNNTSHYVKYKENVGSAQRAELVLNFFPKSVSSVINKSITVAKSGDTSVSIPKDPSDVFVKDGNQFIVNGNVFSSYSDAHNYLSENRKEKYNSKLIQAWNLKNKSVGDILNYISKNSSWSTGKTTASILSKFNQEANIKILDNASFDAEYIKYSKENGLPINDPYSASGVFLPKTNTILVRETASEKTVLHEIAHSLSLGLLSDESSKASIEFKKYFKSAKKALLEAGVDKDTYGLKDYKEFLSEVLTDDNFISALKSIPSTKSESLLQGIIKFFKKLFNANNDGYTESLNEVMFVLDAQDNMNYVSFNDISVSKAEELADGLKLLKNTLFKANKRLEKKSELLKKSPETIDTQLADAMNRLVSDVYSKLEDSQHLEATVGLFEELVNQEIKFMQDDIISFQSGVDTSEPMNSAYINKMATSVQLYNKIAKDVSQVLNKQYLHPELIPIAEKLNDQLNNFKIELHKIEIFVNDQTRARTIKMVEDSVAELDRPVEQMIEDIDTDISQADVFLGSLKDSPDQIMRSIYKMVTNQHIDTFYKTLDVGKDLTKLQEELERSGIKDMSVFHDKFDGKKSGYIVSDKKWGEYFAKKEESFSKFLNSVKQFGIDTIEDVDWVEARKPGTDLNKYYDMHILNFKKKYERQIDGVWVKNPPVNYEFRKLMQNKAFANYYNEIVNKLEESKDKLPPNYSSTEYSRLLLPQIRRDIMEMMKSRDDVFRGLGTRIKEKFIKTDQDTEFGADTTIEDAAGNPAKLIPIFYSKKIDDTNDLSDDITSMTISYFEMADKFRGMTDKIEDIRIIQRSLEERKFTKGKKSGTFDKSNISKALDNFLDMQAFGIRENPIEFKIPGTKQVVKVSKMLESLLAFVRKNNLFASISAISGAAKGALDLTSDTIAKTGINSTSTAWAHSEMAKSIPSLMSNIGKRSKSGKFNLMAEYNGMFGNIDEVFSRLNMQSKFARFKTADYAYFTYTVPDITTKGVFALAVYDDYRLVDGKFITSKQFNRKYKGDKSKKWSDYSDKTLYNAYEVRGGKFTVKNEYKDLVTNEIRNTVKYTIENRGAALTGQVAQYDKFQASRTIIGKFLMLHRNWMVSGAYERFKKSVKNEFTNETEEGYYRSTTKYLGRMITEGDTIKQKLAVWDKLPDYQQNYVRKFLADGIFSISVMVVTAMMNELAKDEPDDYWLNFLAYTLNRIKLEQLAFFNPNEAFTILDSPTAAQGILETMSSTATILSDWDKIEYGAYEDMYKFQKAMIKNSMLKNIWEMRNSDAVTQKNKFLMAKSF